MTHSLSMLRLPERARLAAAVDGDPAALEAVARTWWPEIRRWCLIDLGDPVLADDAAQETLLRLVRFIGRYDMDRPFRPWLRRIAGNVARDVQRRRGRRERRETDAPDGVVDGAADPSERPGGMGRERGLDLKRASERAMAALDVLTPRQREVFVLCDCQGLDSTEAAEQLGVAAPTVRGLLSRARRTLRERLLADNPHFADLFGGPHGR